MFFFLSLFLQQVNGYGPLKAGFAFLPAALSTRTACLPRVDHTRTADQTRPKPPVRSRAGGFD